MKYHLNTLLLGVLLPSLPVQGATFNLNGHTFTLPEGFVIEKIAGSPLVERPIVADYDEKGRLYVADSSGSNEPVQKQLETKPHRIVRLEDVDGDGTYDRSVVFADKMMFPEGAMWFRGSLYVSAPPSIWKLTDTDGDGKADKREEWLQAQTLTGCANDLHGPYRGHDGWIYWAKGAFAEQSHPQADGSVLVSRAAHIFRRHADGGPVEPVMTGGMDNPVDVVFTPEGERIFSTTFFQHPGGGRRDGLVHAIYGGVYGKPHNVLDGHPRTGGLMPVLTHLGPAAPCGLVLTESDGLGPGFQGNLFAANFNLHKVTRHVLQPLGATFKTLDSDFLISDQVDFHPTDVIEDRDGSLIVVDTGGWYKICCPTSQLYKPDVLGAIYRVRKRDAKPLREPELPDKSPSPQNIKSWTALLASESHVAGRQAMETLADFGASAVPALRSSLHSSAKDLSDVQKQRAVWTLSRMDHTTARAAIRSVLEGNDPKVLLPAIHAAGLWRDSLAVELLIPLLAMDDPAIVRATAEALGRIGDPAAVTGIFSALSKDIDHPSPDARRVLEHSLVYALIQIDDRARVLGGLASNNPQINGFTLLALDQMPSGNLDASLLSSWLSSPQPEIREHVIWIASRHPEWAAELARHFQSMLANPKFDPSERQSIPSLLARFAGDLQVQKILADTLLNVDLPDGNREMALDAMDQAGLKNTPPTWIQAFAALLKESNQTLQQRILKTTHNLPPAQDPYIPYDEALAKLAHHESTPTNMRLDALASLRSSDQLLESGTYAFLLHQLHPDTPAVNRRKAASVLEKARLTTEQQFELAEILTHVSPLELGSLLSAFSHSQTEELGLKIMQSLNTSPARYSLRKENLLPALEGFPDPVLKEAKRLLGSIHTDTAAQQERLETLLSEMKNGDVRRGQAVFKSSRTACSTCHAIGYLGGKLGPDLTRIGQIRTERDLLEAIVYPSASFVRSYEPMLVETSDDEAFSGILRGENSAEIILATGPELEIRIPRSKVTEMRPGTVSTMPGGMEEQLSRQELADLVAFLRATRW